MTFNNEKQDDVVVVEEQSLVVTETATSNVRPFDVLAQAGAGQSLSQMLDRYQVLMYVIDESGSMMGRMEPIPGKEVAYMSRTEAVKKYLRIFAEKRFQKYPEAQVGIIGFGSSPEIICYAGVKKDEVMQSIDALHSSLGGTEIGKAMKRGLSEIGKTRSVVDAHHMIVITDGGDNDSASVNELRQQFMTMPCVLDVLYVNGESYPVMKDALKSLCSETGGEFIEVSNEDEFAVKFLQVSNRLALPAPKG